MQDAGSDAVTSMMAAVVRRVKIFSDGTRKCDRCGWIMVSREVNYMCLVCQQCMHSVCFDAHVEYTCAAEVQGGRIRGIASADAVEAEVVSGTSC